MYKITKGWLGIERKSINKDEEITLKLSNEVIFDNDCNAENVASVFDFIRSCLNFQQICEKIGRTETSEIETHKYQIENGSQKQVIEKPIAEVQEIIKEKNEVKQTTTTKVTSAFDW